MAYGNWGAFVYKNGERQKSREDNTPFHEDEEMGGKIRCRHASLGDGDIRLCGNRCYPELYYKEEKIALASFYEGETEIFEGEEYILSDKYVMQFEFKGHLIKIEKDETFIELTLIHPDGTKWFSKCGYCYGAGHDD